MSDVLPPPSGSGRARRSNGLPCAEWGALVDLDPRLSEALLTRLGAAGVPAFVEPASGEDHFSRAAQHPARPLDRLWVDPVHADAARTVVAEEVAELSSLLSETDPGATAHGFVQPVPRTAAARVLTPPALPDPPAPTTSPPPPAAGTPEPSTSAASGQDETPVEAPAPGTPGASAPGSPALDEDEVWRQIVEGFDREVEGPRAPWPAAEDVGPSTPTRRPRRLDRTESDRTDPDRTGSDGRGSDRAGSDGAGPPAAAEPRRRRRRDDAELPDWVEPAALEDDGHFVPPPPPPVPRLAPQKAGAAAAVLLGLLLMFTPGVLLQPRTTGVAIFGVLLTLAGAAAVVYLMRDAPTDTGPDDGAVV